MGQFSWFCQDDNHRILCNDTETIYMVDNTGRVFTEDYYDGYGNFGGKDYYELTAEMNGLSGRSEAIEKSFNGDNGEYFPDGNNPAIIYPSLCHVEPKYFDGKAPLLDPDQGWELDCESGDEDGFQETLPDNPNIEDEEEDSLSARFEEVYDSVIECNDVTRRFILDNFPLLPFDESEEAKSFKKLLDMTNELHNYAHELSEHLAWDK